MESGVFIYKVNGTMKNLAPWIDSCGRRRIWLWLI